MTRRCATAAGKDMTTGLLLEDISPPADGADDGPLGELRRRLTLLQGPQVPLLPPVRVLVNSFLVQDPPPNLL